MTDSYRRQGETGLLFSGLKTADAAIKTAPGKVYWLTISDASASAIQLNDSTDDTGTDLWGLILTTNVFHHFNFDPPIEFATGIWLDVSTGTPDVYIGYY